MIPQRCSIEKDLLPPKFGDSLGHNFIWTYSDQAAKHFWLVTLATCINFHWVIHLSSQRERERHEDEQSTKIPFFRERAYFFYFSNNFIPCILLQRSKPFTCLAVQQLKNEINNKVKWKCYLPIEPPQDFVYEIF